MALNQFQPFVGYEPNPQGQGYLFQHQNGNKYLSYGPGAEQIKAQIDASRPPDQRLAMNGGMSAADANASFDAGAPNVATPDTSPAPVMPPAAAGPAMSVAPPSAPEPNASVAPTMSEAPPEMPKATHEKPVNEPPGRVVPPSGELPMMRGAVPRGEGAPDGAAPYMVNPYKHVAGVNPKKMAENAVAVPTAQQIVREGGIQDPEARQAEIEAFHAQVAAQKDLAEAQKNAATTQLETERANLLEAQRRQLEAEDQIARQQARQATLRQEFDKRMSIAQQDYDRSSAKEVDQYRMFKGSAGATIGGILSVLASGVGALGASISHNPNNYALQTVNRMLDNDIQSQREEIQRGVAKSSNDLQRISQQYNLDYDDAAQILKMNYVRRAEAELAKKAALNGTQQAQLSLAQVQPTFQKWIADAQENLNTKLNGQVKTVEQLRMMQPSAGGVVRKTDEELTKEVELAARRSKAQSTIEHGGQEPGKQGSDKPKEGYTNQTISSINAAEVAEKSLKHAAELAGIHIDEDGNAKVVDYWKLAKAQSAGSAAAKALAAAIPEMVRGQTGAAPTNEGQEHAASQFTNPLSVANAFQENIKLLRDARRIRIENKKYPVAAGAQGGGDTGGGEQ